MSLHRGTVDPEQSIDRLLAFVSRLPDETVNRLDRAKQSLPAKLAHFDRLLASLPAGLRRRITAAFHQRLGELLFPFHAIAFDAACDEQIAAIRTDADREAALHGIDKDQQALTAMYAGE